MGTLALVLFGVLWRLSLINGNLAKQPPTATGPAANSAGRSKKREREREKKIKIR